MTGLLTLGIFGLWAWGAFKFSRWAGARMTGTYWRWPVAAAVFVLLLPLPVLDELIANRQLESLCRDNAVMKIDETKIKGRSVKYSAEPLNEEVRGVAIPVTFTRGVYRDVNTGELLGSSSWYAAKGGVLVQAMGASESNSPMFARSGCAPSEGEYEAAKRLGFTIVKQLGKKNVDNQ